MPSGAPSTSASLVLTRRGRLAATVAAGVASLALVLTVHSMTADSAPPADDGLDAVAISPTTTPTPSGTGLLAGLTDALAASTPGGQPTAGSTVPPAAAPSAGPTVNGRAQPPVVAVPVSASGQLVPVVGSTAEVAGDRVWRYRVEVEDGLPFDGAEFAAAAHATLVDPRGWAVDGNAFQRVDADDVDFRLLLASPQLTDQLCAPLQTRGRVSCRNGDMVVLNAVRWGEGVEHYAGDLASYREYMVNHEVGHRLGHSHISCSASGEPAPVMMQQTYGLEGCTANPWPAEQ